MVKCLATATTETEQVARFRLSWFSQLNWLGNLLVSPVNAMKSVAVVQSQETIYNLGIKPCELGGRECAIIWLFIRGIFIKVYLYFALFSYRWVDLAFWINCIWKQWNSVEQYVCAVAEFQWPLPCRELEFSLITSAIWKCMSFFFSEIQIVRKLSLDFWRYWCDLGVLCH